MQNFWGCNLCTEGRVKSETITYSSLCDRVKLLVPGYELIEYGVSQSGTEANLRAMELAFGNVRSRCLVAMGSYVGGLEGALELSSNGAAANFDYKLVLIESPDKVADLAKQNTVAFPYFVPNDCIDEQQINTLEDRCLQSLRKKLLLGILSGNPYEALLMEYILTGNGASLSDRFKRKLGMLLQEYSVIVVADEIMTGGRVGPTIALTLVQPEELAERVKFITFGKIFGCGLTLRKVDFVQHQPLKRRGISTEIEISELYAKLHRLNELLMAGAINDKQKMVEKALKLDLEKDKEDLWGAGLLLYSSFTRCKVRSALKNRYLPQLETCRKVRKGGTKPSEWTSSVVNSLLFESAEKWLMASSEIAQEQYSPFLVALVEFLLYSKPDEGFSASDLMNFYPIDKLEQMESVYKKRKLERLGNRQGRCSKTPERLFADVLKQAETDSAGYLHSARKGRKRLLSYSLKKTCLF